MPDENLELDALKAKIDELKRENDALKKEIERLRKGRVAGLSGYIIRTPQPFTGKFAGIMFDNGMAFVPDERAIEAIALAQDFGYQIERVEGYVPE